jgi:hypothetical protein
MGATRCDYRPPSAPGMSLLIIFSAPPCSTALSPCAAATQPLSSASPSQKGKTPLHWAALFSQLTLIDKILAKGANIEAKDDEVVCPPRPTCRLRFAVTPSPITTHLRLPPPQRCRSCHRTLTPSLRSAPWHALAPAALIRRSTERTATTGAHRGRLRCKVRQ